VDDLVLLNIIVHFDALINAHRCGLRVEVTNFGTWGGGTQGTNKEKSSMYRSLWTTCYYSISSCILMR